MQLVDEIAPQTFNFTFAPYGVDAEKNQPYSAHPTQIKVKEWVSSVISGTRKKQGIPCLYLQHGVDSGGTRAVLGPVLETVFNHPGIRVLIGRKDYQDLRLSVMETFFEIIPRLLIKERDEQEHRYEIYGKNGTGTVFFRELKDVRGLGSQEFAIIVVCEAHEIELSAYRTLKQRCRQAGYPLMILMEGNPPGFGHWLDKLCDPKNPDHDPDIDRIILTSYENWEYMALAYRTSLEAMPSSWRKRFLLGETCALPSGTPVYPAFVDTVHIGETPLIPDRPLIRGWDFGLRRAACTWFQMSDDGRLFQHKEWMPMETPEETFIDGVIQRTNLWFGARPCRDYGDPAARNRDPNGVSALMRMQAKGIQMQWRQSTYRDRIPLINHKLTEAPQGKPTYTVNPSCQITIEGFMGGYHYPELKLEQEFTQKRDEPFKDGYHDHIINSIEYVFVNLFGRGSGVAAPFIARKKHLNRMRLQTQGSAVF